jgi:protein ImuB
MSPHPRIQATRWVERAASLATRPERTGTPVLATSPPATAAASMPEQVWLALHLPDIEFAACYADVLRSPATAPGIAVPGPFTPRVVIERDGRLPRVLTACAEACARGIQPGMPLAAALAAVRDLEARPRSVQRERSLLDTLAGGSFALTSWVSLEPPDAVLLEVRGSLKLFGGEASLLAAAVERSLALTGARPCAALAPTPLAALVLARAAALAGKPVAPREPARLPAVTGAQSDPALLPGRLAPLPLSLLRWPPELLERLATLGVRSIGEALRLPRAGFARRFGKAQLLALDRLTGRLREPRPAFVPRERFVARCEPACELIEHAAVLRVAEPLLLQLEHFLRQRQIGVTLLVLALRHRPQPGALRGEGALTRIPVRLAAPELAAPRFAALLAERLAQTVLPAPVIHVELRTGAATPFAPGSDSLWRPGEHGGAAGREAPAFLERLRARLGAESVYGLCLLPAHRPESAWGVAEPQPLPAGLADPRKAPVRAALACESAARSHRGRPLWLLQTPEPLAIEQDQLATAGLGLLAGPERIETGWWDGNEVLRDYYIARDAAGAELWLYRERDAPHRWFLQGLFG